MNHLIQHQNEIAVIADLCLIITFSVGVPGWLYHRVNAIRVIASQQSRGWNREEIATSIMLALFAFNAPAMILALSAIFILSSIESLYSNPIYVPAAAIFSIILAVSAVFIGMLSTLPWTTANQPDRYIAIAIGALWSALVVGMFFTPAATTANFQSYVTTGAAFFASNIVGFFLGRKLTSA